MKKTKNKTKGGMAVWPLGWFGHPHKAKEPKKKKGEKKKKKFNRVWPLGGGRNHPCGPWGWFGQPHKKK
jgi:hypothetical protein